MKLRPYQQAAVKSVYDYLMTHEDNPCIVIPTGGGKSIVIATIASDVVKKWHGRVLCLAHVKELLEQNAEKIKKLCPELDVGLYSAGLHKKDKKNDILVAGIQSIYKKAFDFEAFDLVIIDEIHMLPLEGEGRYRTFLKDLKLVNPNVRIVGLTATPFRLDGGLICKPDNFVNNVCYEVGLKEMINNGYLSPIVPKSGGAVPDFDDLHVRAGEFVSEEVEKKMNNERLVQTACNEIVQQTKDRKSVLIFGSSIAHCKKIKKTLESITGEECGIITGDTPNGERAEIIDRIRGKEVARDLFGKTKKPLKYLVNMGVLTTGFDAPNIDCVAILRPTASAGLLVQMVGRGLRLSPETGKKDCLILDYGDNIMRHGPLDAIRVENKPHHSKKNGEPPVKKCKQCNALIEISRSICPYCGFVFPPRDLKHEMFASEEGLLTGQVVEKECEVKDVYYKSWTKKGADENAPKTVCVEYTLGLNQYQREWLCPEHSGYARKKFEKWWMEHRISEDFDPPDSVAEFLQFVEADALKYPVKITVKHITGEQYDKISKYEYGEKPTEEMTPFDIGNDEDSQSALFGNGTYLDRQDQKWDSINEQSEEEYRFDINDDTPF